VRAGRKVRAHARSLEGTLQSQQHFYSKLKALLFSKSYPDSSSSRRAYIPIPPGLNSKHRRSVCQRSLDFDPGPSILFWLSAGSRDFVFLGALSRITTAIHPLPSARLPRCLNPKHHPPLTVCLPYPVDRRVYPSACRFSFF